MGASYPDLNRCIYKFADDRRCRNVIAGPGLPHCRPHQKLIARRVAAAERRAGRPAAPVAVRAILSPSGSAVTRSIISPT